MNEFYRIPALALLSMLLVAFALLYLQARTTRRLLWLIGWVLTVLHLATEVAGMRTAGIGFAISSASMVLAAMMFLGSMSPLGFRRWPRLLYIYAFAAPLVLYSVITSLDPQPQGWMRWLLLLLVLAAVQVTTLWGLRKHLLPRWFTASLPIVLGAFCLWLTWHGEYFYVLFISQAASNLVSALLFAAAYWRLSPGLIFTSAGFFLWSMPALLDPFFSEHPAVVMIGRGLNLIKVMTAVGMILIVLEEEIAQNKAAKERDHRARMEMERYSEIDLSLLSGVNSEAAYQHACEMIVEVSRFSQVLLLLRSVEGRFYVAAHAGADEALVAGMNALGKRTSPEEAERFRQGKNIAVEIGNTLQMDLRPLFIEDDPLEKLGYFRSYVIPLRVRPAKTLADGYLFLSGLKKPEQPLQADDLLPLELLAARLAAMREHNALMQRVARSEKLAGLGQLAAGVAHELNNPLTVVLGYSQILEEVLEDHPGQQSISLVRAEAQRMRQVIESMLRFWRPSPVEHAPVSVVEILRDICQLRRAEFNRRQIELELHLADNAPAVEGNRNQLQQMFLQLINHAIDSIGERTDGAKRAIRVDAGYDEDGIQVLISDTGHGFADPNRAFDPFYAPKHQRTGYGMELSVCYAIVRDHGGEISAHNLQPQGSALVVQLPLARGREQAHSGEAVAI